MQHEVTLVSDAMQRIATAVSAIVLALLAAAPAVAQTPGGLDATIRRTAHGIPHIEAKDYAGLGYGYGYAFAQDNLCTIAEQYVTVRGERSRYFGPDATYTWRANSSVNTNLGIEALSGTGFDAPLVPEHVVDLLAVVGSGRHHVGHALGEGERLVDERALDSDQLCFVKDASGWKIGGYAGGDKAIAHVTFRDGDKRLLLRYAPVEKL